MSKSKKAVFLKEWTAEVGHSMESFHEGAALMVRKHQKSAVKTATFAGTLHAIGQKEHCAPLKGAFEALSQELTQGEEHRAHTLSQLQANIVTQFDKYPAKLKVQDDNIRSRNKAFATFVKKQKAFVASKAAANPTKQRHAREVFEHEHKRLQSAEQTLNTAIVQFEQARVTELKAMLMKYVSSQIYFYSRQMEGLTRAYQTLTTIDPVVEGERWGEEMRKLEQMELEQGDISQLLSQTELNDNNTNNAASNNSGNNNGQPSPPAGGAVEPQQLQPSHQQQQAGTNKPNPYLNPYQNPYNNAVNTSASGNIPQSPYTQQPSPPSAPYTSVPQQFVSSYQQNVPYQQQQPSMQPSPIAAMQQYQTSNNGPSNYASPPAGSPSFQPQAQQHYNPYYSPSNTGSGGSQYSPPAQPSYATNQPINNSTGGGWAAQPHAASVSNYPSTNYGNPVMSPSGYQTRTGSSGFGPGTWQESKQQL